MDPRNWGASTWSHLSLEANRNWLKGLKSEADVCADAGLHEQAISLYEQVWRTVECWGGGQHDDVRGEVALILGRYQQSTSKLEAGRYYRMAYETRDYKIRGKAAYQLHLLNDGDDCPSIGWLNSAIVNEHPAAYWQIFSSIRINSGSRMPISLAIDVAIDSIVDRAKKLAARSRERYSPLDKLPKLIYNYPSPPPPHQEGGREKVGCLSDASKKKMLQVLVQVNLDIDQFEEAQYCYGFICRLEGNFEASHSNFARAEESIADAALQVADNYFFGRGVPIDRQLALAKYRLYLSNFVTLKSIPPSVRSRFLICVDSIPNYYTRVENLVKVDPSWIEDCHDPLANERFSRLDCHELLQQKSSTLR